MATALTSWTSAIKPSVPGCPTPLITAETLDAVREFCVSTFLWHANLDRISVVADTATYALSAPSGGQIITIQRVLYKQDGEDDDQFYRLTPINPVERDADTGESGSWEFQTAPCPSKYYMDVDYNLVLSPIPEDASASGLLVQVTLQPTKTATTVEDFIYNRYEHIITDGALARLFAYENQPWSDPVASQRHNAEFKRQITEAKHRRFNGFTNKGMSVRMRRFV